jgi:hypothetical protein
LQSFYRALNQLKDGVRDLFASRRTLPGFLLLYTSIDILASLTRPREIAATNSTFFKDWVTEYMLPGSDLECDAEEIWGARCGLLHTLTAESNMSRNRGVRMINYIGTVQAAEEMQRRHEAIRDTDIFVPTPRFVEAFITGCERFEAKGAGGWRPAGTRFLSCAECCCCDRLTPNHAMRRSARRSDASPSRNCSHKALPFVEASAKAKLAGSIETRSSRNVFAKYFGTFAVQFP